MSKRLVDKTVLIDDSDIDLFIQKRFLEVCNFASQVIVYKSATEALQALTLANGVSPPDVIFLDLNMPEVDGFTFLKSFRNLPESVTDNCKIVVLTSSNSSKDREQAFTFKNVIHFITKPLKHSDIEDLQNML